MPLVSDYNVHAQTSHPNLFVSAENSLFENHFSGSMVIEVVIRDSAISDTGESKGEPDVTINGKDLRMVQATDGNWYAYFANVDQAKQADQIASTGMAGKSLDFGVFCDRSTDQSVLGVSFSDSDGVTIPDDNGISGATQGTAPFTACTGELGTPSNQNNVVRDSKSINQNLGVPVGQIGLKPDAWPIIQLFSFNNNVDIVYNKGGGSQRVELTYFDIPNISVTLDRDRYPKGAEVFATINDMQLNQDPTSVDSWTFSIDPTKGTFYQAFTESGSNSGNGGLGLVNLNPFLSSLNFEKNGDLGLDLGSVVELRTNQFQPTLSATSGLTTYTKIVTFVETEPNTGIFESFDYNNHSTIGISDTAPRGQTGVIKYNSKSTSILSGDSTATISLGTQGSQFNPGQKATITLTDDDQNFNNGIREDLDVFRSSALIPTLQIGNPVTLGTASDVTFYPQSDSFSNGASFASTIPDKTSKRLVIGANSISDITFEKITLDLGISAGTLQGLFIDVPTSGTNWINYDLRSFEQQLGITSFSDTSMKLYFGSLDSTTAVEIIGPGQISSGKGLVQLSDSALDLINSKPSSSSVFLEINFDASNNDIGVGTISIEQDTQPIVFDLFSFGGKNGQRINNAIYRAELEETSFSSGIFTGTMEFSVVNQLNQADPSLIQSLRTIDDEIKFLVNDKLTDEEGINLAYSDVARVGVTVGLSSKTDITTSSGTVTLEQQTYRFGQPVGVILTDQDLNTKHDTIEIYNVVNNPASPADDTVGDESGNILLEIRIKGFRYHHCTINGVEYGGLGSTGFSLEETGPNTGIFKGSFKMPSQICDESGTKLISAGGGSIEGSYFDFRDASGQPREIELTFPNSPNTPNEVKIEPEPEKNIIVKKIQMTDSFDRPLIQNPKKGQKINFVTEISNNDQKPQSFSYIIQVKDENNKIVDLRWIDGSVDSAKKKTTGIPWEPKISGKYTVEIFVWDGIDSAVPIATKTEYHLNVVSK
ncbi:MAG TPA: peptidase [Nitrosopumilaceae archaeon]|nr:peptidase [Nitrosopumilaceae archaeon]